MAAVTEDDRDRCFAKPMVTPPIPTSRSDPLASGAPDKARLSPTSKALRAIGTAEPSVLPRMMTS